MYQQNKIIAPFWGETTNYNSGRDHLGIQNSSVAIYSKLLPGMTNVTQRVRYYGFYCWVLMKFKGKEGLINYIRRSELLLAFIMKANEELEYLTAVSGSLYASKTLGERADIIDLAEGADKEGNNKYWKYSLGAFGQYFLGSMENLKLIEFSRDSRSCIIHERGEDLFSVFNEGIVSKEAQLFSLIVEKGKFEITDLNRLKSFALNVNLSKTSEGIFYQEMLAHEDFDFDLLGNKLFLRKQTLIAVLEVLDGNYLWSDFLKICYRQTNFQFSSFCSFAVFGWYSYQLNELIHYSLETIFWSILIRLDNGISKPFNKFIKDLNSDILAKLAPKENETVKESSTLNGQTLLNEFELVEKINLAIKENQEINASFYALKLLFLCFKNNRSKLEEIDRFIFNLETERSGTVSVFFNDFFEPRLSKKIDLFLDDLIFWIITKHLSTAFEKMGLGNKNVLKLVCEDGFILGVNVVTPNFTSPRLASLRNFFIDLKVIDPTDYSITEIGKEYLKKLKNEL